MALFEFLFKKKRGSVKVALRRSSAVGNITLQ